MKRKKVFFAIAFILAVFEMNAQSLIVDIVNPKVYQMTNGDFLIYGYVPAVNTEKSIFCVVLTDNNLKEKLHGKAEIKYPNEALFLGYENGKYIFSVSANEGTYGITSRVVFDKDLYPIENYGIMYSTSSLFKSRKAEEKDFVMGEYTGPYAGDRILFPLTPDLQDDYQTFLSVNDYMVIASASPQECSFIRSHKAPALITISNKTSIESGFTFHENTSKISVFDDDYAYMYVEYPGSGDNIYVFTVQFPQKNETSNYGVLNKINYKTGQIGFSKRINFSEQIIYDSKIHFVDNEIILSGNVVENKVLSYPDFKSLFVFSIDTASGKELISKKFDYVNLSVDFKSTGEKSRLRAFNLKKIDGKYSFFADYGECKVMGKAGYEVAGLPVDPYVMYERKFLSFLEFDSKFDIVSCKNLRVDNLLGGKYFGAGTFYEVYNSPKKSEATFLIKMYKDTKTFYYVFGRKENELFLTTQLDFLDLKKNFKSYKLKSFNCFIRDANSLIQVGQGKFQTVFNVKTF
jgi:hypothetical protein